MKKQGRFLILALRKKNRPLFIIIVPTLDLKSSEFKMGEKVTFKFGGNVSHIFSKENEKNLEW